MIYAMDSLTVVNSTCAFFHLKLEIFNLSHPIRPILTDPKVLEVQN